MNTFLRVGIPGIKETMELAGWLEQYGNFTVRPIRGGLELELSGGVGRGMAEDLEHWLDNSPTVRLVHVNLASGGLVEEAKRARDHIRARGLDTYTSNTCTSACTIVFLGGHQRFLKVGARLGFHAWRFYGGGVSDQQTLSDEKQDLTDMGISDGFATQVVDTPHDKMWFPTDEELISSGVVTAMTNGEHFGVSGIAKPFDATTIDASLQEERLYRIIKTSHPNAYEHILTALHEMYQRGDSITDLRQITLPILTPLYLKSLPYSSDETLLRVGRLFLKQLDLLQGTAGRTCLEYMRGTPQGANEALVYFPRELREEELATMADVLATADMGRPMPTTATASALLEKVGRQASLQAGVDIKVFSQLDDPSVDPAKACTLFRAAYSVILALPAQEGSIVLRSMFQKTEPEDAPAS